MFAMTGTEIERKLDRLQNFLSFGVKKEGMMHHSDDRTRDSRLP